MGNVWAVLRDGLALIGGVLGVFNFVQGFWQRRVRLRVTPKLTAIQGGGFLSSTVDLLPRGFACIEVVNLSAFPVTIDEVGFTLSDSKCRHMIIPEPRTLLPRTLEPRTSIDVRATQSAGFPRKSKKAYAKTQCGQTRYGDSVVFKKFREGAFS